jgi:hypothetical protein
VRGRKRGGKKGAENLENGGFALDGRQPERSIRSGPLTPAPMES